MTTAGQVVFGHVHYDPARRRVQFIPDDAAVFASTAYELVVRESLLAWDGTPMGVVERRAFRTSAEPYVTPAPLPAPTLTRDVAPLLAARCALSNCHDAADRVMGLDLSSAEAIRRTAVDVMAGERPAASNVAATRSDPRWVALARLDSGFVVGTGEPAYSYLVYKILGDGPIEGDRMPPPNLAPLSDEEIRVVSDWIAAGARAN